ncbi:hypothetical protein [uncultured Tateyamaria sp.]|uniref:hypothetical protein n=1 Tax=uncultured Tateyamaria sp. TaxID=455651 RepID=UPI002614F05F|nr:hypothetical protein [uncultured Tateyamaria sp.]
MAQISVKVVFDAKGGADAETICEKASEHGLTVEQVQRAIGVIFGQCDDSVVDQLEALDGVLRVSPEGTFQLPPLSPDKPQ